MKRFVLLGYFAASIFDKFIEGELVLVYHSGII